MLVVRPVIAYLLVAAAVSEAANLRQAKRNLQTYTQSDDYFSAMLYRVNQERVTRGLPALCTNKKLQDAAQRHSDDQAENNYMDHTGTDGTSITDRVSEAGYDWGSVAENIAAGQPDVDSVMKTWMNSPGHRANILGEYTMFGTAYAYNANSQFKHYWTQDFGTGETEECYGGGVAPKTEKTEKSVYTLASSPDSYETTETPYAGHVEETDAPCTDEPVVVDPVTSGYGSQSTDEPCTDAPVVVVDPVQSGYGSQVTEEPCTDAPVVVDPAHSEYDSTSTDEPCTDAPVVVVDPVQSGYGSQVTEEPCTDAPVVVDPAHSEYGSTSTDEPCTDAPVVVVDPVQSGYGSQVTEEPCTDAPIVVDGLEIGTDGEYKTDAPVVVVDYGTPSTQSPDNYKPTHSDDCDPGF
ncbi:hypothetical protein V7S43_009543 [Phytophthora oleae]|uniref:SCP domain-containing protein n=1 Tax=Phytophthora oleae TaxID=2107226 RepID=A0ABD3FEX2_9STRA